jgi:hypothetical protein
MESLRVLEQVHRTISSVKVWRRQLPANRKNTFLSRLTYEDVVLEKEVAQVIGTGSLLIMTGNFLALAVVALFILLSCREHPALLAILFPLLFLLVLTIGGVSGLAIFGSFRAMFVGEGFVFATLTRLILIGKRPGGFGRLVTTSGVGVVIAQVLIIGSLVLMKRNLPGLIYLVQAVGMVLETCVMLGLLLAIIHFMPLPKFKVEIVFSRVLSYRKPSGLLTAPETVVIDIN